MYFIRALPFVDFQATESRLRREFFPKQANNSVVRMLVFAAMEKFQTVPVNAGSHGRKARFDRAQCSRDVHAPCVNDK